MPVPVSYTHLDVYKRQLKYGECQCGRTMARMERVTSRTDDMLIIRGVNVYPSQIESVILSFDGIEPYYQILISRENFLDKVEVEVEVSSEIFSDEIKVLENLRNKIEEKIKAELNLSCSIKLIKDVYKRQGWFSRCLLISRSGKKWF